MIDVGVFEKCTDIALCTAEIWLAELDILCKCVHVLTYVYFSV